MLAPSEQANVKKTPTTAYIISVYKVSLESNCSVIINETKSNFCRYLKAMTAKDSRETGFIGLVCSYFKFLPVEQFLIIHN